MRRNNVQKGRYSKRKGAQRELKIAKSFSSWARKTHSKKVSFGRTYSSGASANQFINPTNTLLGDVFCIGLDFPFEIEAKDYGSTSLRRYYEGTKRLSSWLEENTRDTRRENGHYIPLLIAHIDRFGDMVMLPFDSKFFIQMNKKGFPCWSTYESYTVKRTKHKFKFHVILTDLRSIMKCMSIDTFISDYKGCNWDILNRKYTKRMTHQFLQSHPRAEMSKATNPVAKTLHKVKK